MGKLPPLPAGVTPQHVAALIQIFREDVPPVIFDIAEGRLSKLADPSPALGILRQKGFIKDGTIDPAFVRAAQLAINYNPSLNPASPIIHKVALDTRIVASCPGAGMTFADWFGERISLHSPDGGPVTTQFDMLLRGLASLMQLRRRRD